MLRTILVLVDIADLLGCKCDTPPFKYLGLNVGCQHKLWADLFCGYMSRGGGVGSVSRILCSTRRVRGWWGDVIQSLKDKGGGWFESCLVRKVGNGERTSLWDERWIGDVPLRVLFPRLFSLCRDKECTVASAGRWEEDRWVWGIGWRRELREWERSDLYSLVGMLLCRKSVSIDDDRWVWKSGKDGVYSVRSSYECLLKRKQSSNISAPRCCKFIWENYAVPKARAIAWRVLFRKIATRTELLRRGVRPHTLHFVGMQRRRCHISSLAADLRGICGLVAWNGLGWMPRYLIMRQSIYPNSAAWRKVRRRGRS